MQTIEQLLDTCQLAGVTIWISADRTQVNTRATDSDGWSIHYGATPGEALRKALEFRNDLLESGKTDVLPSFF
jgi:hypothetical protein